MQKMTRSNEEQKRGMSRRQLLQWMGGSATGLLVAACVPAAPSGQQPATSGGDAATGEESTTIELWTGFGQGRMADAMSGAVSRFEEETPGYTVNHLVVPWGEIADKTVASVAAGNPPDVYRGWAWMVGEYAPIGGLTPLNAFIEAHDVDLTDFWEPTLEQMQYQGEVYGMSISTMVDLLYYNKDTIRDAGFDPDDVPTALEGWEEIGAAATVVSGSGELERIGFVPFIPTANIFGWGAAFGATFWDAETGTVTADHPAMVRVLEWFKGYGDRYGAEQLQAFITSYGGNNFGRNTPQGAYYTGLLSIWNQASWLINDMREYGPDVDFGITSLPSPSDVTDGKPGKLQANLYFVPTGAKNAEGGFLFANFMSSSPWVALNKAVPDAVTPSRRSLANLPEVEEAAPWITLARDEVLPFAMAQPSMPAVDFYQQLLSEAYQNVLFNDADPATVLADVTERTQREVEKRSE